MKTVNNDSKNMKNFLKRKEEKEQNVSCKRTVFCQECCDMDKFGLKSLFISLSEI